MSNLIERMSFIVPVTCISFIFVIFSVNLYTKIRKIFPIKVNCWFCNKNASVPYSDYNSWNCTHCMQYNGFDKDGDYNCDIPAQRSIQLNKRWKTGEIDKRTASVASNPQKNRLCDRCNRNQELKIQQLASFEPIVKENFDMEIEDFRVKLEKSYELCYNCQRSVKKTLNRIMSNVLGLRLAQIGGKGLQMLDLHAKRTDSKERIIFNRICLGAITVLSVWNLFNSSHNVHLSRNHFDTYFPPYATNFALTFISFISAIKLLVMEYLVAFTTFSVMIFKQMCSYFTEDKFDFFNSIIDTNDFQINFVINLVAVLLSLKLVLAKCSKRLYSLLLLFLWNVNMLWSTIAGSMVNQITGNLLNFFFGVIIMVVAITLNYTLFEEATYKCPSLNNSFHRIFASCDEDLSDDESSFNNNDYRSSSSSKRDYEQSISPDVTSKSWEDLFQDDTNRLKTGKDNRNSVWYQQQQQYNRDFSERNLTNDRLYSPFCIPDDCQNKLIDLKIGGMNGRNHRVITCSSPTPSILINDRDRSQLLTPARLNFNDYSPFSASATKTSWVAGGFFVKNLSPQKRQQPIHPISRTSSQSSGFESRASSIHNGYTNGSRESSVAGDAASYYLSDNITTTRPPSSSSPISFYDCPVNDSFSLFTKKQTFNSTLCKPESENDFCLTNYAYDKNIKPLSKSVYHQFGTHRLNLNDSGSVRNRFSHHSVNLCKGNIDETNLFNSNC